MKERIGQVWLEDRVSEKTAYPPEMNETEKRLMEIISSCPEAEYPRRLAENPTWPLMQQLSPLRESLMNWIPLEEGQRVLEIGAECGPVTGAFLNRGLEVVSADPSPIRCRINATRHREAEGLTVIAAETEEALSASEGAFDLVAWPNAPGPAGDAASFLCLLRQIRRVLKPEGALFLATENPLGLKYFSGRPEESTGRLFESIEGFPSGTGIRTYSRRELIGMAEKAGYAWDFYYPYPDHWLPEKIFTEERLPREGELNRNWQCFDADRVIVFDEGKAFDSVIRAGLFPELANAFLLCLRPEGGAAS